MFRDMRRFKQALTQEQCIEILKNEPRGVLALHGDEGYPYAIPMNHIYIDGKLYFHCAKAGHKIDAVNRDNKVSFCVMDKGYRRDGEWALNINSVVVFGRISTVSDPQFAVEVIRKLGLKYYPNPEDVESEINTHMSRAQILQLTIDHMTGKLVNES